MAGVCSRRAARLAPALLVAAAALAFCAPALAKKVHVFSTTFGAASSAPANPFPLSNPAGVAVDNSTGPSAHDVYVTDPANHRVEQFGPSGEFILMFGKEVDQTTGANVCTAASHDNCRAGKPSSSPGGFMTPTFVAVDGSAGPSSGDVYVGDTFSSETVSPSISKFEPSGNLIASWRTGGQLNGIGEIDGIAVDQAGNLFTVGEPESTGTHWYEQNGTLHSTFGHPRGTSPAGLGVDAEDHLYKVDGSPEVTKFTNTGVNLAEPDKHGRTTGIAIDPATNDLYAVEGGEIVERFALNCGEGCTPVEAFGSGDLKGGQGIGIDGTSGNIYVANSESGNVAVFVQGIQPEAVTETATGVTLTAATLHATVGLAGGTKITSCHFEYGTDTTYKLGEIPCEPAPPYGSSTNVTAKVSGLTNNTTYHYRVVVSNEEKITAFGQDQTLTTLPAVEQLSTEPATNLTGTSASLNGSWFGNKEDTHYFFEWGYNTLYGNKAPMTPADGGATEGHTPVSAPIGSLSPTTTYHFRIVAENARGTTYGLDRTVETLTFPVVKALQTTELETSSVRLNAMVKPTSGEVTACHFEYGLNAGEYTSGVVSCSPTVPYGSPTEASTKISGLSPGTMYHYRLVAISPAGTYQQPDQSFTAEPLRPTVDGTSVLEVRQDSAMLGAQIKPGFGPTLYFFEYGNSPGYGFSSRVGGPLSADNSDHTIAQEISGLLPGKAYHFRVVAINFGGSTHGPDEILTTTSAPQVISAAALSTASTAATLAAQINPGRAATTYHFEYGSTTAYGSRTSESASIGADGTAHAVGTTITGLTPGTTYHFRVVATNPVGATPGLDGTFTTGPVTQEVKPPPPLKCRRGFVMRRGKCVKRHRRASRHHKRGHRHG